MGLYKRENVCVFFTIQCVVHCMVHAFVQSQGRRNDPSLGFRVYDFVGKPCPTIAIVNKDFFILFIGRLKKQGVLGRFLGGHQALRNVFFFGRNVPKKKGALFLVKLARDLTRPISPKWW